MRVLDWRGSIPRSYHLQWRYCSCNTRLIKGHKPSNHIRARIKSHVYTTEWTVYHSTYHVKRYNKANTNVIYYINDKNVWYRVCGTLKTYTRSSRKQGATGISTGRRMPRSPCTPGSSGWTPSRRQELSSSRVSPKEQEEKSVEEARVSTQLVLNKYNTNYEALRLADTTALAFKPWQSFIKANY